jgi:NAD(P)-dependent dehydrogenase (short-subunit alcohol dehydrogenase family)
VDPPSDLPAENEFFFHVDPKDLVSHLQLSRRATATGDRRRATRADFVFTVHHIQLQLLIGITMMKSLTYFFLAALTQSFSNAFAPPSASTISTRPVATFSSSSLNAMPDGGVVITGSAGGVGFAYAGEFMDRGYDVVICDVKDCTTAAKALTARHPNGKVYHTKCDVSDASSCEALGQFAKEKLGNIGYWINNAGINGGRRALSELTMSQVETVVKVNLLGIFYCTKVAMDIMAEQEGFTGHIFNTVGSGVKGGGTPGYATYGATKRGLPQLTASLVKEIDEGVQGYPKKKTKGKIQVHSLSPGMVFTKLLLDDSTPGECCFCEGV